MQTKILWPTMMILAIATNANAWRYDASPYGLRISGYGTAGLIEPDFKDPDFLGDFDIQARGTYAMDADKTFGLVYSIDGIAVEEKDYVHDAFMYIESRSTGRIEAGFTDSVARKLALGLPDVGAMRIGQKPIFYKKIHPTHAIISDTSVTSGRDALRINVVSAARRTAQYGMSIAGISDDYDFAIDAGAKFRMPTGKIKTAYSFGASFIDNPDGYQTHDYSTPVHADWRAQVSAGMNLQYNSLVWGINARGVYDESPIGIVSDGISAGTGISYDLLKYTVSATYIMSDTGIWHSDADNHMVHTGIASFRYKYSQNVDLWASLGVTSETPFMSVGLRLTM